MQLMITQWQGDKLSPQIVDVTITTHHAASSYGIPVLVLPSGDVVDYHQIIEVIEATPEEFELLQRLRRAVLR